MDELTLKQLEEIQEVIQQCSKIDKNVISDAQQPQIIVVDAVDTGKSSLIAGLMDQLQVVENPENNELAFDYEHINNEFCAMPGGLKMTKKLYQEFRLVQYCDYKQDQSLFNDIISTIQLNHTLDVFQSTKDGGQITPPNKVVLLTISQEDLSQDCSKCLLAALQQLKKLFPNVDGIKQQLGFVVTQTSEDYTAEQFMQNIQQQCNNNNNDNKNNNLDIKQLCECFSQDLSNIFLFPKAEVQGKCELQCREAIFNFAASNYKSVSIPKFVLSKNHVNLLLELLAKHEEVIIEKLNEVKSILNQIIDNIIISDKEKYGIILEKKIKEMKRWKEILESVSELKTPNEIIKKINSQFNPENPVIPQYEECAEERFLALARTTLSDVVDMRDDRITEHIQEILKDLRMKLNDVIQQNKGLIDKLLNQIEDKIIEKLDKFNAQLQQVLQDLLIVDNQDPKYLSGMFEKIQKWKQIFRDTSGIRTYKELFDHIYAQRDFRNPVLYSYKESNDEHFIFFVRGALPKVFCGGDKVRCRIEGILNALRNKFDGVQKDNKKQIKKMRAKADKIIRTQLWRDKTAMEEIFSSLALSAADSAAQAERKRAEIRRWKAVLDGVSPFMSRKEFVQHINDHFPSNSPPAINASESPEERFVAFTVAEIPGDFCPDGVEIQRCLAQIVALLKLQLLRMERRSS